MLLGVITLLAALSAVLIGVGTSSLLFGILGFVGSFLTLAALAFGFFFVMCQIVDPKKPQE